MKSKNIAVSFFILSLLVISINSCKDDSITEPSTEFKGLNYPSYFGLPHYNFTSNPLTAKGVQLGRELFYDPILSIDSTISCGSCHSQTHAFADHNGGFSEGVNQAKGNRNAPAIFNLAWNTSFMLDGGINHIEIMPLAPIVNPLEMNETISNVLLKLNRHRDYPTKFYEVFGKKTIDDQMLFYAITQFQGTIISDGSKYDMVQQGKSIYTIEENAGYQLFKTHCSSCHKEPLITDNSFRNNGLDTIFNDLGREKITQLAEDRGKFKVPSLRNVELTYPYMHNGSFFTLESVIDHYTDGIKLSPTLDPRLSSRIKLTGAEKFQLVSFLKTLTDYTLLSNPNLTKPR